MMKKVTTNSSSDSVSANSAPAKTAGAISGRITVRPPPPGRGSREKFDPAPSCSPLSTVSRASTNCASFIDTLIATLRPSSRPNGAVTAMQQRPATNFPTKPRHKKRSRFPGLSIAGAGFEPATFGL